MLVLKRHYQFWFAILGLHKLGAVAVPATNLLQEHDFSYRFNAAGISAILCTADGDTAHQVEIAEKDSPTLQLKILVRSSLMNMRYMVGGAQKVVMLYLANMGRMSEASKRSKS